MKRLEFEMPEFRRVSWVSDTAREVWEPRIRQITKAWQEIKLKAATEGICPCTTVSVPPESLISMAEECARAGLTFLPLGYQGVQNYSYSNQELGQRPTGQFLLNGVIGSAHNVLNFKTAVEVEGDVVSVGKLLGHPSCCQKFFREALEAGQTDTTWLMAQPKTGYSGVDSCFVEVTGDPHLNIFWHCLGIRAVPHFPCSFTCKYSSDLAKEYVDCGRKSGYGDEMNWLLEILAWPVQWSALHGIAEIKTPILRASTKTDVTNEKHTLRYLSDSYPNEGAKGLDFPYGISSRPKLTQSKEYKNGLNKPIETVSLQSNENAKAAACEDWYYIDNGFGSRVSMDAAHKPIEELAVATLSKRCVNVLDLGCGNGALLQKIQAACPEVTPFGIDCDSRRIEHARILFPNFRGNFAVGKLLDFGSLFPMHHGYKLVMLALSRLEEMDVNQRVAFGQRIQELSENLLVYDYWNRDLREVARRVGLQLVSVAQDARASLARFSTSREMLMTQKSQQDTGNKNHTYKSHGDSFHGDHSDHGDSPRGHHGDI